MLILYVNKSNDKGSLLELDSKLLQHPVHEIHTPPSISIINMVIVLQGKATEASLWMNKGDILRESAMGSSIYC